MAATECSELRPIFFTWRTALLGRYHIFHLHWPEQLVKPAGRITSRWARSFLGALLILRLRFTHTPIVYTLHNHAPHDGATSRGNRWFASRLNKLVRHEIHLVPEPDRVSGIPATLIPHGSYRAPFSQHHRCDAVPGRMLLFGMIRPYKGIERLIDAFTAADVAGTSLRIVGQPLRAAPARAVRDAIRDAAQRDGRISYRFAFISDADLVAEVTSAQIIALPYVELHSSGAALAALSLDRPILVPDCITSRALRDEVGPDWVHIFSPPLTARAVERALSAVADRSNATGPDLSSRSWHQVRKAHLAVYRRVLGFT